MTLQEMKNRKQELGYSVETLSKMTGIPRGTLQKIFSGQTKSPRQETIEKLTAVLEKKSESYHMPEFCGDRVAEGAVATSWKGKIQYTDNPYGSKKQGEYTVDDYLALPDDKRYELIDGVIYEMASPTKGHQDLAGLLYIQLFLCASAHNLNCHPYIAPLDVQLDKDNKTMVQPDVIVVCEPDDGKHQRIFGAPDFAAEVLSETSRRRDVFIKLNKYKNAGVKEYWMIDPEKKKVTVCLFYKDDDFTTYTFDDDIPVSISDGKCSVCFSAMMKQMPFS